MGIDQDREGSTASARVIRPRAAMRARTRRQRWVLALLAMVSMSGCSFLSPDINSFPGAQADGVPLTIQGVEFENLVVVAPERGARGVLAGQAVNVTERSIEVTVTVGGERRPTPARFTLAHSTGDGISSIPSNVDLGPIPVIPGATVTLLVSTPRAGVNKVSVPVLPPGTELDYYDGIRP